LDFQFHCSGIAPNSEVSEFAEGRSDGRTIRSIKYRFAPPTGMAAKELDKQILVEHPGLAGSIDSFEVPE
jgi:hypothetical protein